MYRAAARRWCLARAVYQRGRGFHVRFPGATLCIPPVHHRIRREHHSAVGLGPGDIGGWRSRVPVPGAAVFVALVHRLIPALHRTKIASASHNSSTATRRQGHSSSNMAAEPGKGSTPTRARISCALSRGDVFQPPRCTTKVRREQQSAAGPGLGNIGGRRSRVLVPGAVASSPWCTD